MFISSFCSKPLIWVLISFPSLLVPFISLFMAFTFSSIWQLYSTISVSTMISNVLNSASDRLAISSPLNVVFFLELWSVLSFGPYFFCLFWHTCYIVMASVLGICKSRATLFAALWHCMWGRGPRGNNATYSALGSFQSFSPLPTSKLALLMLIPGPVGLCMF